ncbi:probable ATP-dependent helicase PF08_0048 [Aphidius gifuensis]|uniref:probable ATP-dependent helicase PF08_0048 n=1 Tax=Aphidius gifuensis TaxID=684658 RepID=UPI001CDB95B6|nr:probable ATP-dependent helicase PF08_0048 [Aphidius gifuensis]
MDNNLSNIPLIALSDETKKIVSNLLNPIKTIPVKDSTLTRDWRALAHFCGTTAEVIPVYSSKDDPTNEILNIMIQKKLTIQFLIECLEEIDRWDVIDDIKSNIENDLLEYHRRINAKDPVVLDKELQPHLLTKDDVLRAYEKKKLKKYQTFFLYHHRDNKFAAYIRNGLEKLYNVSICDRTRDLIRDDLDTIKRVIDERCVNVLVLMSNNFINDEMTETILTYIEKIKKKITPLACTRFTSRVPRALESTVFLNYDIYYKQSNEIGFWKKLAINIHITDKDLRDGNIVIETYEFFDEDLQSNKSNSTVDRYVPLIENEPINNPHEEIKNDDNVDEINHDNSDDSNHDTQQLTTIEKVKKICCFFWPFKKKKIVSSDSIDSTENKLTNGIINRTISLKSVNDDKTSFKKKICSIFVNNNNNNKNLIDERLNEDGESSTLTTIGPDSDNNNNNDDDDDLIKNSKQSDDKVDEKVGLAGPSDESINLPSISSVPDLNDDLLKNKKNIYECLS